MQRRTLVRYLWRRRPFTESSLSAEITIEIVTSETLVTRWHVDSRYHPASFAFIERKRNKLLTFRWLSVGTA